MSRDLIFRALLLAGLRPSVCRRYFTESCAAISSDPTGGRPPMTRRSPDAANNAGLTRGQASSLGAATRYTQWLGGAPLSLISLLE